MKGITTGTPLVSRPVTLTQLVVPTVVLDMIQYSLSVLYDNRHPMYDQLRVATTYT
jgi:hypothetical protein